MAIDILKLSPEHLREVLVNTGKQSLISAANKLYNVGLDGRQFFAMYGIENGITPSESFSLVQ